MATTPSIFTILNCDCCRRLFGSEDNPFKKAFLMKFLRGVMDVYRRDDDDEDGMRVTSITRMVFPYGLLQSTDHHLLYLTERSTGLRELSLPLGRNIKHEGFSRAIRYWNGREEMSIGPVLCNNDIFSYHCSDRHKLQAAGSPRIVRLGLNSTIVS
ncbi:hypothetical protein ACSBR2_014897 [Camellia fascicularis]